ncbi:hypothetical protein SESBI_35596 [Sesbania bispinosa]|nr:hypothetical protein SESBI_35596 [Sesbania bispinosa]
MWEEEGHLAAAEGARWRGLVASRGGWVTKCWFADDDGARSRGDARRWLRRSWTRPWWGRRGYSHGDGLVTHGGDTVLQQEVAAASLSSSSYVFFCFDSLPLPGFLSLLGSVVVKRWQGWPREQLQEITTEGRP